MTNVAYTIIVITMLPVVWFLAAMALELLPFEFPYLHAIWTDRDGWRVIKAHGFRWKPKRPPEPHPYGTVWYRGWEVCYDYQSGYWSGYMWRAYKGGVDLDAPEVSGRSYTECLDEVDEAEA